MLPGKTGKEEKTMIYSAEVEQMCPVKKGAYHGPAPIPEEGKWVQAKEIGDISGLTHGVGWCAPQQGACKLTLNVKNGVIEEALVETLGCSGMKRQEKNGVPQNGTSFLRRCGKGRGARRPAAAVPSCAGGSLNAFP